MKRIRLNPSLLTVSAAIAGLALGAGIAFGAYDHDKIPLYTFEEIGMQFGTPGNVMPVQVGADNKGMPYSPKMTCSGGGNITGCHNYNTISDHAFHSAQGRNEFVDTTDGRFVASKNKPWTGQSTAMVGKW